MKNNKLFYLLSTALVLSGVALFSFVSANNDNNGNNNGKFNNEDRGNGEQANEAHQRGTTMDVRISEAGKVSVSGAKVTAVTASSISVSTSWGAFTLNWTVNPTSDVRFSRKFGGSSSLSEISVGDLISFRGDLVTTSASPIVVSANVIKDFSIQMRNADFKGTVKSVDAVSGKFVLSSTRSGDITVVTMSSTKFQKGDGNGVFADVVVGARVLARGVYDSQLKVLQADGVKIYVPEAIHTDNGEQSNH